MKKALTILLLVFCLSGIYVAADGREAARGSSPVVTGLLSNTLTSMSVQRRRRRWRRWRRWHRRERREERREGRRGRRRGRHNM